MPGKFNSDFHPAILPALLMLNQRGKEMEKSLDDLISFIQSTKNAMEALRNGVETFHAGLMKMVPPSAPKLTPMDGPAPPTDPQKPTDPAPPPVEHNNEFQDPLLTTNPNNE